MSGAGQALRVPGEIPAGSPRVGRDLGVCSGLPCSVHGETEAQQNGEGAGTRIWAPQCPSPGWRGKGEMSDAILLSGLLGPG